MDLVSVVYCISLDVCVHVNLVSSVFYSIRSFRTHVPLETVKGNFAPKNL